MQPLPPDSNSPFSKFEKLDPQTRDALGSSLALAKEYGTLRLECPLLVLALVRYYNKARISAGSTTLDQLIQEPSSVQMLSAAFKYEQKKWGASGPAAAVGGEPRLSLEPEAQSALADARKAWPRLELHTSMVLVCLLERSESARALLEVIVPSADPSQSASIIDAVIRELRVYIKTLEPAASVESESPTYRWSLPRLEATTRATYAGFHVSLREQIIGCLHNCEGRFPVVVAARLGEPTGCYLGKPNPIIGQVIADYLTWPDIDPDAIFPLRLNQKVYLVTGQDMLDITAQSSPQVEILIEAARQVQEEGGVLVINGLQALADSSNDPLDVQRIKNHLRGQFRRLAQLSQRGGAQQRPLLVVALYQLDPLDSDEDSVVQRSLKCAVNQHMVLVTVKRYPVSRAIGSLRDYYLPGWIERGFTMDGFDNVTWGSGLSSVPLTALEQALRDSAQRVQLGAESDRCLREVFADVIFLEHGAYVNDERMRIPYLLIEVCENLMNIIAGALQSRMEGRRVRELAYQAHAEIATLLASNSDVPQNVRHHYTSRLVQIQQKLLAAARQPSDIQVIRRDNTGRIVITRDLINAAFLGSVQSAFKWPKTPPKPLESDPPEPPTRPPDVPDENGGMIFGR